MGAREEKSNLDVVEPLGLDAREEHTQERRLLADQGGEGGADSNQVLNELEVGGSRERVD